VDRVKEILYRPRPYRRLGSMSGDNVIKDLSRVIAIRYTR